MRITLPYPPSVNHYYRHHNGHVIISKHGREYRKLVVDLMRDIGQPMQGRLSVKIDMHPPDARRRDVDNVLKPLLDALQHGRAFNDDSQIDRLTIERMPPIKYGYTVVEIDVL